MEVQLSPGRTTCLTMTTVTPTIHQFYHMCVMIATKEKATQRAVKWPDRSEKYLRCVRRSSPSFCLSHPRRSTIAHISATRAHNPRLHHSPYPLTVTPSLMRPAAALPVHRHLIPGNLQIHENALSWKPSRVQNLHPARARSPLDPIRISRIPRVLPIRAHSHHRHFSRHHHTNQDTFRASARTFRQQRYTVAPVVAYRCRFRHPRRQDPAWVPLPYHFCHLMDRLGIHHGLHCPILGRAPMTCSRTCLDPRAEAG